MTEPVGGGAELDGHEGVAGRRPVEAVAVGEDVIDHLLAGDLGQVLIDEQPLVVPQRDLSGEQEGNIAVPGVGPMGRRGGEGFQIVFGELVQDPVVEQDVAAVQAGDHHVLVVAGVAEQGGVGAVAVLDPRYVFVHPAAADLQLRADRPVGVLDVEVRAPAWAAAEDGVEIQGGRAGVR